MAHSTKTISPLRQRMIDDMTLRQLQVKTQSGYLRSVKRLTKFLGRSPDLASAEDLRAFQKQLVDDGVSSSTINATIRGLRFFFETTLERPEALKRMSPVRIPDRLPLVLSAEDVARLLNAAPNLKSKAALSVAYGAGLRASEVCHLKLTDIDSERMIIRVEQGKGSRDRQAMLSPMLLQLLRAWWREGRRLGNCSCIALPLASMQSLARCSPMAGYSPASIPLHHYRPANSTGCVRLRQAPLRWISGSRCIPCDTVSQRTCWNSRSTSASSRCYSVIRN